MKALTMTVASKVLRIPESCNYAACREMRARGQGPMFLGCRGSAVCVQLVHWVMRSTLSFNVLNCGVSGSSGLTYLRGQKQCWLSRGKMILLVLPSLSMLVYSR